MQPTSTMRVIQAKVTTRKIVQYVDKIEIGAENDKIDYNTQKLHRQSYRMLLDYRGGIVRSHITKTLVLDGHRNA